MPSPRLSFFGLLFLLLLMLGSASQDDGVVITSSGPVKGKTVPTSSGSVTAFLGIPYAEPPVGKLRFQKPRPHQPWSRVLEATSFGNSCPQTNISKFPDAALWTANTPLSEDCLFLNVWVPSPRPVEPMPVLVWIQGIGLISGTASLDIYNGALLAATEKVIVASMNYRLGALGFLYMPPEALGNVGLWDQWLALKWLRQNAAAFGGDPAQLTLLGQSAGAAMVGFHLLSPASNPLFARAVLQSGVPNAFWPWKTTEDAEQDTVGVSSAVGCASENRTAVLKCLQEIDIEDKAFEPLYSINSLTIDGEFLPDEPPKLLDSTALQGKPVLTGITADEGSTFVLFWYPSAEGDGRILTWEELLQGVKGTMERGTAEEVAEAVALRFSEGYDGPERYRLAFAQYFRDYFFSCALHEFAAKMSKTKIQTHLYNPIKYSLEVKETKTPVYVYSFDHRTSASDWPEWVQTPYAVEIPYLFGSFASAFPRNKSVTQAEVALSRRVMRYWAEFARSGNPTRSEPTEAQWPVYDVEEQKFFQISTAPPQLKRLRPPPPCDYLATLRMKGTSKAKPQEDTA
ncbi:Cholinesterase [Varanus komodoensis]|uniref:Carboxylic ester hydrolase n=1 Tax=Varanus komodoensis TaxID=61221 RepID=A0A8D2IZH9_VARKO|nr:cholinesterase-like [Varanus komodoensis]KAF7234950.1 Cholinesterase [Varanus komodoensis]